MIIASMQILKNIIWNITNFLVPEDKKIERWLKLSPAELMRRLPKPRSIHASDASALFDYRDNSVRAIIKAIKYRGNVRVIKRMAGYLYEEIIEFASDMSIFEAGMKIIIVPMPSSDKSRRERGWSQCELLCKEIKQLSEDSLSIRSDILKKIKDTKKQTDLKREERLNNVKGSMKVAGALAKDSTIIVVDDVYTTGATFAEAKRALKEAGAKRVVGLFLAH